MITLYSWLCHWLNCENYFDFGRVLSINYDSFCVNLENDCFDLLKWIETTQNKEIILEIIFTKPMKFLGRNQVCSVYNDFLDFSGYILPVWLTLSLPFQWEKSLAYRNEWEWHDFFRGIEGTIFDLGSSFEHRVTNG